VSFVVKHEVVLNRSLLFIALSLFTWGIGEGMFFNFSPIYMAKLGSDPQQIGLILGAFGAVMAITHIPAGRLADRFGRRPLLVIAWAMGLAATVVMALARDLPLFVAGLLGYGLTAFVSSPLSSYMTAARGRWSVAATLSLTTATFSFGMALGPALGGWIGDRYGLRMVYSVAAGIFVVSNVLIQFIEPQPLDHHDPESPPVSLLSNVRFLNFLVVVALAVFAMYLAQPLTPNFLAGVRGLSLGEVGVIFTAGALGNALVSILLGRFPPRIGYPISQALVGLFALLMWRGTGLPCFALGYFLLGGFRAARPLALAQVRELVHTSQMGLTYGTMETVTSFIFILTPPLAGYLYEHDPYLVYPITIGLILLSMLVSIVFAPHPPALLKTQN
jgi:MFS family permease